MPAPRLHITDEALRQAWASRRRSSWPASFDEAMADPLLCRLVRAVAVGQALAALRHAPRLAVPTPRPAAVPAWRQRQRTTLPHGIDLKRRAAGDRDD